MSNDIRGKQWVGVDLHLHRSVICRIDERGQQLDCVQIDNDPKALMREVRKAGRGAPVAVEATYGWYWAVEALQAAKFEVHLAHPYGMKAMRKRKRVKPTPVTPTSWRTCCAWGRCRRATSPRPSCGSCGSWSGTAGS